MGVTYYIDFDHTVFDTDLFFHVHVRDAAVARYHLHEAAWDESYEQLLASGYNIAAHLQLLGIPAGDAKAATAWILRTFDLTNYLYSDVEPTLEELRRRGLRVRILTAGNTAWQLLKVRASHIVRYVTDVLIADKATKLDVLQTSGIGSTDIIVDNDPAFLDAICKTLDGRNRTYLINRVPALVAADRASVDRRFYEARRYINKPSKESHIRITSLSDLL